MAVLVRRANKLRVGAEKLRGDRGGSNKNVFVFRAASPLSRAPENRHITQATGQGKISYTRYPEEYFTKIYRDLYGDAMLVHIRVANNMSAGNQQKHLSPNVARKA